jgi:hypothetical protein
MIVADSIDYIRHDLVTFGVGILTRNVIAAILLGGLTLFAMIWALGAY